MKQSIRLILFLFLGSPTLAQPLSQLCFPTTHNSYNVAKGKKHFLFPNHTYDITRQLNDSIRGFMLDVYERKGEVVLYHGFPVLGTQKLNSVLLAMQKWLVEHPSEVVAIIFENYISQSKLLDELKLAGMEDRLVMLPNTSNLPTLQQLQASHKQLLVFVESEMGDSVEGVYPAWKNILDTPWSIKPHAAMPNYIGRGSNNSKLFLMNHWIDRLIPNKRDARRMNDLEFMKARIESCKNELGRYPNFIGVNFHHIGSVVKAAKYTQNRLGQEGR